MNRRRDLRAAISLQEVKPILDINPFGPDFCGHHGDTSGHGFQYFDSRPTARAKRHDYCYRGRVERANVVDSARYMDTIRRQGKNFGCRITTDDCEVQVGVISSYFEPSGA